jgi:hypothetical protein
VHAPSPTSITAVDRPIRAILWALPVLLLAGSVGAATQPIELRSEADQLVLRITGIDRPERLNHLHGFEMTLTLADGRPAAGASIMLSGQHRYALNPLPTSPRIQPDVGPGRYKVEGLRFHVAGEWRLFFAVELEHVRDRISLDVLVK